jgi:two-component system cell cycle sensor histidine kinase/response regulator CckA
MTGPEYTRLRCGLASAHARKRALSSENASDLYPTSGRVVALLDRAWNAPAVQAEVISSAPDNQQTERDPAERAIDMPRFYRDVVFALSDGVFVLDPEGTCVEVNPAFCQMLGFSRSELVGHRPPFPFWPAEHASSVASAFKNERCGRGVDRQHEFQKKSGETFPILLSHAVIRDEQGRPSRLVATAKDITELRRLERALKRSEQTWRSIAENPHEFVSILDRDLRFLYCNRSDIPGIDPSDLRSATPFAFVDERHHAEIKGALTRAFNEGVVITVESYAMASHRWHANVITPIKEDGEVTSVSVLTRDITDQKRALDALWSSERSLQLALAAGDLGTFECDVAQDRWMFSPRVYEIWGYEPGSEEVPQTLPAFYAKVHPDDVSTLKQFAGMQAGGSVSIEYRIVHASGEHRWVHGSARAFADADGTVRMHGLIGDISARKQAELEQERFRARMLHAQKMDTLGTLAGGIAHDFNNILMPILGNVELLRKRVGEASPLRDALAGIQHAATRAQELVARILVFGRAHEEECQPVNVPAVAREALDLVSTSMPPSIKVRTQIADDCPVIWGYSGQIHQAITNLCTNAYQALKETGGQLCLSVGMAQVDDAFRTAHDLPAGPILRVAVEDDGKGIPRELQERIFEPFFTTKGIGEGTGLGLAMVHSIVKQHKGTVQVLSAPQKGACFELYFPTGHALPRCPKRDLRPLVRTEAEPLRILCVDDDLAVLAALDAMLRDAGHDTVCLASARDALGQLEERPTAFDLVITDYTMPHLTGIELARGIEGVRSDLPVILMSGYADIHGLESRPRNIRSVLQKPMTLNMLLSAVQRSSCCEA